MEEFVKECGALKGVDADLVRDVAVRTVTYLRGDAKAREQMRLAQVLEQRWYDSLGEGEPDWSVYDTDYYLGELWACWTVYSRKYLRSIRSRTSLSPDGVVVDFGSVRRVADLGCGFGYTTAALVEMFPGAVVVGTNLDGTAQTKLARRVGRRRGFRVVSDVREIEPPVDVVFASEYFEHVFAPIQHLRKVIDVLRPRVFLIANAFGTRAIGHFDRYSVDGEWLDGKATSKRFGLELRRRGFVKVKTKMWNNRPAYWKKEG